MKLSFLPTPEARRIVWEALRYMPHRGQRLIHESPARHRVGVEGRRAGKSYAGGHELTTEAQMTYDRDILDFLYDEGRRREFWIVGPEYSDSEKEFRVLHDDCKRLGMPFDRPGTYYIPDAGEMVISLFGGKFIARAMSAKHPETLVGEGLCGVVMAEAAKLKKVVWSRYVRPALADSWLNLGAGWSLFLTTPEGKNWVYELWQDGKNPLVGDWESWRFPSWINTLVFPGGEADPEIEAMRREMSPEYFAQEIEAKFTEFAGAVFKDFDEEVHVRPVMFNPAHPVYLAIDYGWTNPFVVLVLQVDQFDNVYVLAEHYVTERDTSEVAHDLLSRWPVIRRARALYPDPAEPDDTHTLSRIWKVRAATNTGGELKTRLELIRRHLKSAPVGAHPYDLESEPLTEAPRLLINNGCTNLIREMQDYRYPATRDEALKNPRDEPLDKDNHGPEALGRFFRGYFGKIERPRTTVRRANIRQSASPPARESQLEKLTRNMPPQYR